MLLVASTLIALVPLVTAQTFTSCNPLSQSCPPDPGFTSAKTVYNFQQAPPDNTWAVSGGDNLISQDKNGLHFSMTGPGQAPTLNTKQYLFFGTVTATIEAAQGPGIVSAFILQSDDLDEIDWEWLGGVTTVVQSNYFSKGDTSTYDRGATHAVSNPQTSYHTYAIEWSSSAINWVIDGTVVRTLEASAVGSQYPQTPMQVKIGTWCGGCAGEPEGTVQWSGGPTNFNGAPYVMTITNLEIDNANPAGSYSYGDKSGSASSIKLGDPVPLPNSGNGTIVSGDPSSSSASSASASSSASSSASTAVPASTTAADPPSTTTLNVGPTSSHLMISGTTKSSFGGLVALVFGAILLLAQ